jgi:hypothetical protein
MVQTQASRICSGMCFAACDVPDCWEGLCLQQDQARCLNLAVTCLSMHIVLALIELELLGCPSLALS